MSRYVSHWGVVITTRYIFIIKVKGEWNRKITYRKTFHKGRYKDMREYLAKIDWNNTLKNKTATECWNILKTEIDCVVDTFVPVKKQGKW